jgi:hypothetical protein
LVFIAFLSTPVKTEFKGVFLGFLETNEKDHQRLGNTVKATPSGKPMAKIEESNRRKGAAIYFNRNSIVFTQGGDFLIQYYCILRRVLKPFGESPHY